MSDFDGDWNKWQNEHEEGDSKKGEDGEIELEIDLSHFMLNEYARLCSVGKELFNAMSQAGCPDFRDIIGRDLVKAWTAWNSKLEEASKYVSVIQQKIDTITGEKPEDSDD